MIILTITTALFAASTVYLYLSTKKLKNSYGDVQAKYVAAKDYAKTLEDKLASTKTTKTSKPTTSKRGPKPKAK